MLAYALVLLVCASLPYVFKLACCGMALWLSRDDQQLKSQLFKTLLTLIARGPSKTEFAIRAIEALRQPRPSSDGREITSAGTRAITDKSREIGMP